MNQSNSKSLTGVGIFAAIAASLCCIAPILAIIAGISGAASAFSWLEPARPYLIGLAVVTLGYAWYKALDNYTNKDCEDDSCEIEKKSFFSSKAFLMIITVFAILLMAFPYYSKAIFPEHTTNIESNQSLSNSKKVEFNIKGMGCQDCTREINNEIAKVNGLMSYNTTFKPQRSVVSFDSNKTTTQIIMNAINKTGYKVTSYK